MSILLQINNNDWLPPIHGLIQSQRTGNTYQLLDIISKGGFGTVFRSKVT